MFLLPVCTVCKKQCDNPVSYFLKSDTGGTITKACCNECSAKTNDKWIENGWNKHEKQS